MVNGLYTASRSMSNILAKQEVHTQNLANASSTGFKLSRLVNSTEVKVSVSIGGASYPAAGIDDAESFLRAADEALYRAKKSGRNCVRMNEE